MKDEARKNKGKLLLPTPVRLAEATDEKINRACGKLNLAKQDVIRLAIDIGLRRLESIKYDIAKAVLEVSEK